MKLMIKETADWEKIPLLEVRDRGKREKERGESREREKGREEEEE